MTSYTMQESPLGTFALLLGTQLIMQASDREDCERVKAGLEHRGHAQRILASTYYDAETNTIKDRETNA